MDFGKVSGLSGYIPGWFVSASARFGSLVVCFWRPGCRRSGSAEGRCGITLIVFNRNREQVLCEKGERV